MRGLRISQIVAPPQGEQIERCMSQVLESGVPVTVENCLPSAGAVGEPTRSVRLAPLTDTAGTIRGILLAAQDSTELDVTRQRLRLLNEASARIGSTLDVGRTAQELADVATAALGDFVSVDLLVSLDHGGEPPSGPLHGPVALRRVAHRSVLPGTPEVVVPLGEVEYYPEYSPPAECLAKGHPVSRRITDESMRRGAAQDPVRAARIQHFGAHTVMAVPMRARGTTLGVAVFFRHRNPEPYERDDLLLAEEMTARAAVCIDNARRYTLQRETALTLQRSLLPTGLPRQSAVRLASRYLPAGAQAGVGGDWFDAIPLSGTRVALVVGDVVGHGIQASATMGRLRTAVRTLADIDLPPDELLTRLDDLVSRLGSEAESDGDVGATCLYAIYDPISRLCSLARAGHPLPALVTPDGTVKFVDLPAGPPLGLGGWTFEAVEIELPEGTLLALYTDGLIESRDRDIDEGYLLLGKALARPAASLDTLCDTVCDALLPAPSTDDVALLLARTRALPADQVATWDIAADPALVGHARKLTSDQLTVWAMSQDGFAAELVVSELVTNAIRYGEPPIQLRLIRDRALICEVSDISDTAPHLRRARVFDEGGRGLMLVSQLAQRWGTRHTPTGKTIWAELPIRPSQECGHQA
ncbi:serine phosphatase RsbU (regulator of sigma subunit) [Streptacidiphilus sp. EB103A]